MDEALIPVLAAATAGAFASVAWVVRFTIQRTWKLVETQQRQIANHFEHNTAALIELRLAVQELSQFVRAWNGHRAGPQ